MKAYTLRLPDEMTRTLKHISVEVNQPMRNLILESLRNYLLKKYKEYVKTLPKPDYAEKNSAAIASESSLAKDWLNSEEEEAWKDL